MGRYVRKRPCMCASSQCLHSRIGNERFNLASYLGLTTPCRFLVKHKCKSNLSEKKLLSQATDLIAVATVDLLVLFLILLPGLFDIRLVALGQSVFIVVASVLNVFAVGTRDTVTICVVDRKDGRWLVVGVRLLLRLLVLVGVRVLRRVLTIAGVLRRVLTGVWVFRWVLARVRVRCRSRSWCRGGCCCCRSGSGLLLVVGGVVS